MSLATGPFCGDPPRELRKLVDLEGPGSSSAGEALEQPRRQGCQKSCRRNRAPHPLSRSLHSRPSAPQDAQCGADAFGRRVADIPQNSHKRRWCVFAGNPSPEWCKRKKTRSAPEYGGRRRTARDAPHRSNRSHNPKVALDRRRRVGSRGDATSAPSGASKAHPKNR